VCTPSGILPTSVINKYAMINHPIMMRKGAILMEKNYEMISTPYPRSSKTN
jgi:hypothetical protein